MEAATVARLAQMRDIEVCCFKAVSDEPEAELPDLNSFIGENGHLRLPSFLAYVAVRPRFWGSLLRLGRNSSAAADAIAERVNRFLIEKNVQQTNRTGAV
jgi:adenosylhomocysteine nucleosidase